MLNKGSNGCKSRPVSSLYPFLSRFVRCHAPNGGDCDLNRRFGGFWAPNRLRTTWCVQLNGVCSRPVMLNKGSNGCKSRPVFSPFPFLSRLVRCHAPNGGDCDPNHRFGGFWAPNRLRTTWCVQLNGVCSRPVMLNKGLNGCKSRPVFSLFPFLSRFVSCHAPNGGDCGLHLVASGLQIGSGPRGAYSHRVYGVGL